MKAKEDAALKALAAKDDTDPWIVADVLCRRGAFDAASAFARASPRPDVEALPAYVETMRKRASDTAEGELLDAINAALISGKPQDAVAGTVSLAAETDTVIRVRLRHTRGNAFRMLQRWHEASEALRSAADAALALGWLRRAADVYMQAAEVARDGGEVELSLSSLDANLTTHRRRSDRGGEATALGRIAIIQMDLGKHEEARAGYEEALRQFETLEDAVNVVWILKNAAVLCVRTGEHDRRLALLKRLLPLQDALQDAAGAAQTVLDTGGAYRAVGEDTAAFAAMKGALARFQALSDKKGMAAALINLGTGHRQRGDEASALDCYTRGLDFALQAGYRPWIRNALMCTADVHLGRGDYAKALAAADRLLELQKAANDETGALEALVLIGGIHTRRSDFAKAVSTFEQAFAGLEALGEKWGAANTLNLMGIAYSSLGDYAKALSCYEKSLARMEALGDKAGQAAALIDAGAVYKELQDYANARSRLERGLALAESVGHRTWKANALLALGTVHEATGAVAEALSMWKRARNEFEALGDTVGVGTALHDIALAHEVMGDHAQAISAYEQALAKEQAVGDKEGEAMTLRNLGKIYLAQGDRARAVAAWESSRRMATARRLTPVLIGTLADLSTLHLKEGNNAFALREATEALRLTENMLGGLGEELGATARTRFVNFYEIGALAAMRERDPAELFTLLEGGRAGALLDDLEQRDVLRWKAETLPPELRKADLEAQAKELEARRAYDEAVRGTDLSVQREAGKALDEATEGVRRVAEMIQRSMKMQAAFYYPRARTLDDVRSTLAADQALVLYGLCLDEALALVVRPKGERIVSLGRSADVVAACEALDPKDLGVDPTAALEVLRKRLVVPLGLEPDVRQVLVSPHGALCYLPFGALFDQTVALTPSGTAHALLLEEQREPGHGVLAFGDPSYAGVSPSAQAIYQRGHVLTPLPATRVEVKAFGTTVLLGADASEAKFYDAMATTSRWRAVHFACHGLVDVQRPMFSSLALSQSGETDGFLTAREIRRTKISADLAVLSACETGTGKLTDGEGIRGLARSFLFAGTPRVICSLWKVDDEATKALMIRFYELWNPQDGKPGLPTAEALRKAQEFVRSQEKWKHPYYWAAWVLWGLPS